MTECGGLEAHLTLGLDDTCELTHNLLSLWTGEGEQHCYLLHIGAHAVLLKYKHDYTKALTEAVQGPIRGDEARDAPVICIQSEVIP